MLEKGLRIPSLGCSAAVSQLDSARVPTKEVPCFQPLRGEDWRLPTAEEIGPEEWRSSISVVVLSGKKPQYVNYGD
jgi:hypothetical protein